MEPTPLHEVANVSRVGSVGPVGPVGPVGLSVCRSCRSCRSANRTVSNRTAVDQMVPAVTRTVGIRTKLDVRDTSRKHKASSYKGVLNFLGTYVRIGVTWTSYKLLVLENI